MSWGMAAVGGGPASRQCTGWKAPALLPVWGGRVLSPSALVLPGMLVPRWALTANGGPPGTGVWGWGLFRRLVSLYRKMGKMACLKLLP